MILHAYYYCSVKKMILHAYYYCGVKKSKALGMIPATLQSNFFHNLRILFLHILFSKSFSNKQRPRAAKDGTAIVSSFAALGRLVLTHTRAQSIHP